MKTRIVLFICLMMGFSSCQNREHEELIRPFDLVNNYIKNNIGEQSQEFAGGMVNDPVRTKPWYDKEKYFLQNINTFDSPDVYDMPAAMPDLQSGS